MANNVFVYCEIEGTQVQEVSQELLTKGRKLANELKVELHAIVAGTGIKGKVEDLILPYGVDKLFVFDAKDQSRALCSQQSDQRSAMMTHVDQGHGQSQ